MDRIAIHFCEHVREYEDGPLKLNRVKHHNFLICLELISCIFMLFESSFCFHAGQEATSSFVWLPRSIAQVDVHAAVGFGLSELPEPRGGGRLHLHGGNRQAQDFDELRQIPGI